MLPALSNPFCLLQLDQFGLGGVVVHGDLDILRIGDTVTSGIISTHHLSLCPLGNLTGTQEIVILSPIRLVRNII